MTSRLRGYCFTINNYTELDMAQLVILASESFVTYMVTGFEIGPENGIPHIQGYIHFTEGKTMKQIVQWVPRISLKEARAEGEKYARRYEYCMKDDNYWESGKRPVDGAPITAYKVKDALAEGKSIHELRQIFPLYMISNGPKVKSYMGLMSENYETQFYVYQPISDALTEIQTYFDGLTDLAVVTDLSQLEAYDVYRNVIFFADSYEKIYSLWPRGSPITYKYGYQQVVIKCENFIIVSETPNLFSFYRNISDGSKKIYSEEKKHYAAHKKIPIPPKNSEKHKQ